MIITYQVEQTGTNLRYFKKKLYFNCKSNFGLEKKNNVQMKA